MVKVILLLELLSVLFVNSAITRNEAIYTGTTYPESFRINKPSLPVMYHLCNLRSPAETNETANCLNWFRTTIDHCAAVLEIEPSRGQIMNRITKWIFPSFKTLKFTEKITLFDPEGLTESDCKLLLAQLARDYVVRALHYQRIPETMQSIWAILCLITLILMLVALTAVLHRLYLQILRPKFQEREKVLRYFEQCASEIGAARHRSLVTVNKLMNVAKFEAKHLHVFKIETEN